MASKLLLIPILIFLAPVSSSIKTTEVVFCDGEVSNFTKIIQFMSPNYPEPQANQQTLCKLKINLTEEDFAIKLEIFLFPCYFYHIKRILNIEKILKPDKNILYYITELNLLT